MGKLDERLALPRRSMFAKSKADDGVGPGGLVIAHKMSVPDLKAMLETTGPKRTRGAKRGVPIMLSLQPELVARLDALRGDAPRQEAIRLILERELPK